MSTRFLFPHKFRRIGFILLVASLIAGTFVFITDYQASWLNLSVPCIYDAGVLSDSVLFGITENNITDEIVLSCMIVGGLLAACSKTKDEDEYISQIRLESLLWATYINYGLLLFCTLFLFGGAFWNVMIFNMFTLLVIFLIRFNYLLYKSNTSRSYEK